MSDDLPFQVNEKTLPAILKRIDEESERIRAEKEKLEAEARQIKRESTLSLYRYAFQAVVGGVVTAGILSVWVITFYTPYLELGRQKDSIQTELGTLKKAQETLKSEYETLKKDRDALAADKKRTEAAKQTLIDTLKKK